LLSELLKLFPERAYPLFLAHDPDGLLNDESVLTVLSERGFTLIHEVDSVHLRYRAENAKPYLIKTPIIIRTENPLNTIPFDLWQQGHHVSLGLNAFFPYLAYPVLKQLSPTQIWRLSQSPSPSRKLGQRSTIEYILINIFELDLEKIAKIEDWVIWLNTYHQKWYGLPELFSDFILACETAKKLPNLEDLIASKDTFNQFLQEEWSEFINSYAVKETQAQYIVNFANSQNLQLQIGNIISKGILSPIETSEQHNLPHWALPGVFASNIDPNDLRLVELENNLISITEEELATYRWEKWQDLAWDVAEYISLSQTQQNPKADKSHFNVIDRAFLNWLQARYSALATQILPKPHHLFHVPHYLAYQRRKLNSEKTALIIMDGMALADWIFIRTAWKDRNPSWKFDNQLVLAQIPSITAISRQALISGLRPMDFSDSLVNNHSESKQWITFWKNQEVASKACIYERHKTKAKSDWIDIPRLEIVCLINNTIDDLMHNTTLGLSDFYASLRIWLEQESHSLESTISDLLTREFRVYITSDHGHVEASGFGSISEGVTVQTRSKRARVYNDINFAQQNQQSVSPSLIWSGDGILPNNIFILIPEENHAFVPHHKTVIAHGGASISEVIVPLVTIGLDN